MLGVSFPPFPFPFLAWIAFVPFLAAWDDRTEWRSVFVDIYVAFLAAIAVAFQWPLFHVNTETALLSLPPLLILPMWMALPFALSNPIRRHLGLGAGMVALAAFFILMEFGLSAGPLAFPWPLVGHSQSEWFPVNQIAAIGGVPLLTLLVLAANCLAFLLLRRFQKLFHAVFCGAASLMLLGIMAGSTYMNSDLDSAGRTTQEASRTLRVAGIQPSFSPESWADLNDSTRVSELIARTRTLLRDLDSEPDLIVWPETAIPPRRGSSAYTGQLQAFTDSTGVPMLAGAITSGSDKIAAYRNSALFLVPGHPVRTYDKINLVPFAERVPFVGRFPFLRRLAIPAGGVAGYEPGKNRAIFEISGQPFGVLICLETLFSDAARTYARGGAHALIAITQDGWWGDTFGYRQHLAFNRLRSIETGLPMIQASVSGVSALIYPDGRIHELAGWMESATWMVDLPASGSPTFYVERGDWTTAPAALIAITIAAIYGVRRRLSRPARRDGRMQNVSGGIRA